MTTRLSIGCGMARARNRHRPRALSSALITVRQKGDCYLARAGRGAQGRTASSTTSAYWAAQAAAEKLFGKALVSISSLEGGDQHGTVFRAFVRGEIHSAARKP